MTRVAPSWLVLGALVCACHGRSPTSTSTPASTSPAPTPSTPATAPTPPAHQTLAAPPASTPAPPPATSKPPPDDACAEARSFHRETLERGREREIAFGGLKGSYVGQTIDHFDDGTSAVLLELELFGEPWLPDARDDRTHALATHCVRLVSSDRDRVVIDVAIQPRHEYDSWRCQMHCCAPGTSRAPDGTEECCFCSDEPR